MNVKEAVKRAAEDRVLEHLTAWPKGLNGPTARELALELGWPWQQVSKVLRRLVVRQVAHMKETTRKDPRYRVRVVRRFEPVGSRCALPPCFEPRPASTPPIARLVRFHLDG